MRSINCDAIYQRSQLDHGRFCSGWHFAAEHRLSHRAGHQKYKNRHLKNNNIDYYINRFVFNLGRNGRRHLWITNCRKLTITIIAGAGFAKTISTCKINPIKVEILLICFSGVDKFLSNWRLICQRYKSKDCSVSGAT